MLSPLLRDRFRADGRRFLFVWVHYFASSTQTVPYGVRCHDEIAP